MYFLPGSPFSRAVEAYRDSGEALYSKGMHTVRAHQQRPRPGHRPPLHPVHVLRVRVLDADGRQRRSRQWLALLAGPRRVQCELWGSDWRIYLVHSHACPEGRRDFARMCQFKEREDREGGSGYTLSRMSYSMSYQSYSMSYQKYSMSYQSYSFRLREATREAPTADKK